MNLRFCHECRGLVLADFRFCPRCGAAAAKGPGLAEALDGPFDRLAVFAGAAASLARLESDMDLILEAMEREGRASS